MKKFKVLASTIIVALLTTASIQSLATATPAFAAVTVEQGAYTTSDGLFKYNLNTLSGDVTITQYLGNQTSVTIPGYINNKQVSYISKNAFYGKTSIKYVGIPILKGIGDNVFYGCTSLQDVKIHENVRTFGVDVFKNCPIKKITIDRSNPIYSDEQISFLTAQDWTTYVSKMPGVNVANVTQKYYSNNQYTKNLLTGYTYTITNNQLTVVRYNGTSKDLVIPQTMEGATVVALGPDAFGIQITSISLPSTVTTIYKNAIFNSSVSEITLSSDTMCSGDYALAPDDIDSLTIDFGAVDLSTVTEGELIQTIEGNYNMDTLYIGDVTIVNDNGDSVLVTDIVK